MRLAAVEERRKCWRCQRRNQPTRFCTQNAVLYAAVPPQEILNAANGSLGLLAVVQHEHRRYSAKNIRHPPQSHTQMTTNGGDNDDDDGPDAGNTS
jgi:hypothetical protein